MAPLACRGGSGLTARVITYGAILVSLDVPDRDGGRADVTLGYDRLEDYTSGSSYFGATVGRYANRIGKARFILDDQVYELTRNEGENHLHGGHQGFDKVVWGAEPVQREDAVGVKLRYLSRDGEEGYPGSSQLKRSLTRVGRGGVRAY
jgi:aldose 1-epimerase